jgi:hypothetical protein
MATMLEEYIIEEQCSVVHCCGEKDLDVEDIHKKTFPVYGGKCLSHKAVHNWVKKFSDVQKLQMRLTRPPY